jgi:hypothetical protein
MENETNIAPGDSPWQSVRLGFGALLLILSGLGLLLLDSNRSSSTARSSVLVAHSR